MMLRSLTMMLALALPACAPRPGAPSPISSSLAIRHVERGAYVEVRSAPQWIDLVRPDGSTGRVQAPPTRVGARVRSDLLMAARRAQSQGHAVRIVDAATD